MSLAFKVGIVDIDLVVVQQLPDAVVVAPDDGHVERCLVAQIDSHRVSPGLQERSNACPVALQGRQVQRGLMVTIELGGVAAVVEQHDHGGQGSEPGTGVKEGLARGRGSQL